MVAAMEVGLRGGSGGVLPNAVLGFWCEFDPTAPECVLARCRKGFVEPGVTGVGAPAAALVSTCLNTEVDVVVEGVWLWV